jgi:hypothetical protein
MSRFDFKPRDACGVVFATFATIARQPMTFTAKDASI